VPMLSIDKATSAMLGAGKLLGTGNG